MPKNPFSSSQESVVRVLREVVSAEHDWNFKSRWGQRDAVSALTTLAAHYPLSPQVVRRGNRIVRATADDYRAVTEDLEFMGMVRQLFPAPTLAAFDYIDDRREQVLQAEIGELERVRDCAGNRVSLYRRIIAAGGPTGIVASELATSHPSFIVGQLGFTFGALAGIGIAKYLHEHTPSRSEILSERKAKVQELEQLRRSRTNRISRPYPG